MTDKQWTEEFNTEDIGIEVSLMWRAVASSAKAVVESLLENGRIEDAVSAAIIAERCLWQATGEEAAFTFSNSKGAA